MSQGEGGWGLCARGVWCGLAEIRWEGQRQVVTPAPTPRALCDGCRKQLVTSLGELPRLFERVSSEFTNKSNGDPTRPKVGGSPHRTIPIREDIDELLTEVSDVLRAWRWRVAQVAGLQTLPAGSVAARLNLATVAWACHQLAVFVDVLLALPDAATAADELFEAHHRCRTKLGMVERNVAIAGVCPLCETAVGTLNRSAGDIELEQGVHCTTCGSRMSRNEYAELIARALEGRS